MLLGVTGTVASAPLIVRQLHIDLRRPAKVPGQEVEGIRSAPDRASPAGEREQADDQHDDEEPDDHHEDPKRSGQIHLDHAAGGMTARQRISTRSPSRGSTACTVVRVGPFVSK